MLLLDVNVLVYAHRQDAPEHRAVRAWLEGTLRGPGYVAVTEQTLAGFLRVVTHPKVFMKPTPLDRALDFVKDFRGRERVRVVAPSEGCWRVFVELCAKTRATGNAIPDAYHAATAIGMGYVLVSCDSGFARFPGLSWRHPLDV